MNTSRYFIIIIIYFLKNKPVKKYIYIYLYYCSSLNKTWLSNNFYKLYFILFQVCIINLRNFVLTKKPLTQSNILMFNLVCLFNVLSWSTISMFLLKQCTEGLDCENWQAEDKKIAVQYNEIKFSAVLHIAPLLADPPNATHPLGKIQPFGIHHFILP